MTMKILNVKFFQTLKNIDKSESESKSYSNYCESKQNTYPTLNLNKIYIRIDKIIFFNQVRNSHIMYNFQYKQTFNYIQLSMPQLDKFGFRFKS
jgi:hypothetical protein